MTRYTGLESINVDPRNVLEVRHGKALEDRIAELEGETAALQTTIVMLQRALWIALDGKEVVVRDNAPDEILWAELPDGGQLVRRMKVR